MAVIVFVPAAAAATSAPEANHRTAAAHFVQALLPNDDYFAQGFMWGLSNTGQAAAATCVGCASAIGIADADIDAPEAWDMVSGCGVCVPPIVAVIDTGIYEGHEDFNNQIWANDMESSGYMGVDDDNNGFIDDKHGWDWSDVPFNECAAGGKGDNQPDPTHDYGGFSSHGTGMASAIGSTTNNGTGIAGVNDQVRLMNLRVGGGSGSPIRDTNFACAIEYAAKN
ncbi:MAG: S8 family serine peptidase, partial [Thermoleophilaceae bacterium]|nr:S8 family serine peptidase [Thermoleophilaceae bacterium]